MDFPLSELKGESSSSSVSLTDGFTPPSLLALRKWLRRSAALFANSRDRGWLSAAFSWTPTVNFGLERGNSPEALRKGEREREREFDSDEEVGLFELPNLASLSSGELTAPLSLPFIPAVPGGGELLLV